MQKFWVYGIILVTIDFVVLALYQDIHLLPILTGITGGISLVVAVLMVGSLSPQEYKENELIDKTSKQENKMTSWSSQFLLVSLPSLVVCLVSGILVFH